MAIVCDGEGLWNSTEIDTVRAEGVGERRCVCISHGPSGASSGVDTKVSMQELRSRCGWQRNEDGSRGCGLRTHL